MLQGPVHGRIAQGLDQGIDDKVHQADDVRRDVFLQSLQGGGPLLGVDLRQAGGLVADVEKFLALGDDVGGLIALPAHQHQLVFQRAEVVIQLLHLVLKGGVVQADDVQLVVAIAQTVNKGLHVAQHPVLGLTGNLYLHQALGLAPHQTGIVDHPGRALDAGDQIHHHDDEKGQNGSQNADARLDPAGGLFVFLAVRHGGFPPV